MASAHGAPSQAMPAQPSPPDPMARRPRSPRRRGGLWFAVTAAAGLVVGFGIGAAAFGSDDDAVAAAPSVTVTQTVSAEPTVEASGTAEAPDPGPVVDTPAADPVEPVPPAPAPVETAPPAAPAPDPAPVPKVKPSYKQLSSRGFQKLVKNPDHYAGKTYTIFGAVTQFDSATGTDTFRADIGPAKKSVDYFGYSDYDQNSFLNGTTRMLKDVVEDDLFRAHVVVVGSYSYETTMGGNITVPEFDVVSISVYGHAKG
jgi:nucleoid-associated protein YgaU